MSSFSRGKIFLCCFVALMASGCATSLGANRVLTPAEVVYETSGDQVDGFDAYEDIDGRFHINYPNDWYIVGPEDAIDEVYFVNPSLSGEPHKAIVAVFVEKPINDIYEFAEAAEKEVQSQKGIEDFLLSDVTSIAVNGLPGIERLVHYTLSDQVLAQRTVYIQHTHHTFVLSLTVPDENIENYSRVFEKMIRSFSLAGQI